MKKHLFTNHIKYFTWVFFLMLFAGISYSQQQITVNVSPTISKAIEGEKELVRKKYFNIASSSAELNRHISDSRRNTYIEDLEMTVGRQLFMVYSAVRWGNNVKEDASRQGFADMSYLQSQSNPSDAGLDYYKTAFGESQDLACHDGHNAYPEFMDRYNNDSPTQELPSNTTASSELAANVLKYNFTDFQRPTYFELVNEPDWRF